MVKKKLLKILSFGNEFSLIAYPVSYHFDNFIGGCYSLENKICFSYDLNNVDNHGKSKFVFALLDHSDSRHRKRGAQYVGAGGNLAHGQRLTQDMWLGQFGTLYGYNINNTN